MPAGIYDHSHRRRKRIPGIYAILNTETGETYVGSSKDIIRRLDWHSNAMKNGWHKNCNLLKALKEYGYDAFAFLLLEECEVEKQYEQETYWLQFLDPEYNLIKEASPFNRGLKMPEEVNAKNSAHMIGNQNLLGHVHSEKSRILMSEKHKGIVQTAEHIAKRVASRKANREFRINW